MSVEFDRESPGKFDSRTLNRKTLSRWTGRRLCIPNLRTQILGFYALVLGVRLYQREQFTPSPPTKSFPTKSPRVELSGRLPIQLYGHENSHP